MLSKYVNTLFTCCGSGKFLTQVAASNLRFGDGVTREVGMDLKNMKATKVCFAFWNFVRFMLM